MCRLKDLSKTFNIDTLKGHFPHYFNTEANQNYVGKIPERGDVWGEGDDPEDY
jgi:hypothetical protein